MADSKLTELTAITDAEGTEIIYIVDDPGGTPVSKKITVSDLLKALIGGSTGATDNAILRADGTGGATAQSSGVTIDDNGRITVPVAEAGGVYFGDSTEGIYEASSTLQFKANNAARLVISASGDIYAAVGQGAINSLSASATVPSLLPGVTDANTGIGRAGADLLSLIAGGAEGARVDANATAGNTRLLVYDVDNGTLERVKTNRSGLLYLDNYATDADTIRDYQEEVVTASPDSTQTLNFQAGNLYALTLGGNVTISLSNIPATHSGSMTVHLIQDATGSRTITWPATIKWSGGAEPTLSTAASAEDVVTLWSRGGTVYGATVGTGFATA